MVGVALAVGVVGEGKMGLLRLLLPGRFSFHVLDGVAGLLNDRSLALEVPTNLIMAAEPSVAYFASIFMNGDKSKSNTGTIAKHTTMNAPAGKSQW